jgi:hypothetical protein
MSFFHRSTNTTSEQVLRKDGNFLSFDNGKDKDAGAKAWGGASAGPSPVSHMHMIGDQHDNEALMHKDVANKLGMMGFEKGAAQHRQAAVEHGMAGQHYHAAADSVMNATDQADPMGDSSKFLDAGKDHLKAARDCAGKAKACCDAMN